MGAPRRFAGGSVFHSVIAVAELKDDAGPVPHTTLPVTVFHGVGHARGRIEGPRRAGRAALEEAGCSTALIAVAGVEALACPNTLRGRRVPRLLLPWPN